MIETGKIQTLTIAKLVTFGAYLDAGTGNPSDNVLLPKNQLPPDAKPGDTLDVFIYRDSEERPIATCQKPRVQVGELAYLKVVENTKVGAFLDWGLEKDLFLPFKEQKFRVQAGASYLFAVYLDKADRPCATTALEPHLRTDSPYKKGDIVHGTVYMPRKGVGIFVAVEDLYAGFVPEQENFFPLSAGDQLQLRVINVREDGKLTLSTRQLAHKQMRDDAAMLLGVLEENDGDIPLNDRSDPEAIKRHLHLSKKAFKRAVGQLLKAGAIEQTEWGIRLKTPQSSPHHSQNDS
ncbi:RNA-binding protein [candidate division KSB3 bacterium]|uniref:RNA-binding protein n=1 Tax=candidate division KSB3 bacterium TaxID=2044937 RepID=A0A2G6KE49_9BACT|nr:MAG: RNA-binding protein [candidate division KSB3 bacterium]